MRRLLAALASAALLAACSSAPEEGVVHDKDYKPAWTQMVPGCWNSTTDSYTCMVPIHHAEQWRLWLCPRYAEDRKQCGWRKVRAATWLDIEVGDYYEVSRG